MGVMLSAAGSLRWFRDAFAPDLGYPELVEEAAAVPAGSDGLLFLPYLTGERTPHPDPAARGAFVGLTIHHRRPHLTRAVLEGVAFGLRDSLELTRSVGAPVSGPIRATGGGSRSRLWRRILADVLEAPVATTSTSEGAAQGAAMLAAVGLGWFTSVAASLRRARDAPRGRRSLSPDARRVRGRVRAIPRALPCPRTHVPLAPVDPRSVRPPGPARDLSPDLPLGRSRRSRAGCRSRPRVGSAAAGRRAPRSRTAPPGSCTRPPRRT